jgi:CheY-like chemotaxis protein
MEANRDGTSTFRILLVEDHADTADSMAMILRLYGHDVVVARDGLTALQIADDNSPDVVLLDIALPNMDGWRVARELRQPSAKKRQLLVAITGYGDKAARLRSYEAGIDLHLVKPVDGEELQKLLASYHRIALPAAKPNASIA